MAKVEQKHLEGLTFRGNVEKTVKDDNGVTKKKFVSVERPLTVTDIIKQEDNKDTFHIVTADGKKYDIPKSQKAGATGGAAE